jgi:hypothetical protein
MFETGGVAWWNPNTFFAQQVNSNRWTPNAITDVCEALCVNTQWVRAASKLPSNNSVLTLTDHGLSYSASNKQRELRQKLNQRRLRRKAEKPPTVHFVSSQTRRHFFFSRREKYKVNDVDISTTSAHSSHVGDWVHFSFTFCFTILCADHLQYLSWVAEI